MNMFLQQFINGLNSGSIYALIAIGYTLVYGILKLINFAHGEIMMFGAYFAFIAAATLNWPFWAVILFSMVLTAVMGVAIEFIAYRPLRNAPRLSALITAIGVSMFLQNLALAIFGADPKVMPKIFPQVVFNVGGVEISSITLITIGLSVVFMVLLEIFINQTKQGRAMRAVSENQDAAVLMGINVDRTISITFLIGSALGALGGILYSTAYTIIEPTMGTMPGLKAFVAAVLGGIGSVPGAMLGGFIIGMVETMTKAYLSSTWADAIVFGVLILVLLFKPTGILGKNMKEKV
ncbi:MULTISPECIES: branched-chain amino acid ABC transporter permease [Eubacterium]|uniref:Branched-chain amino acid transport system permease protein n=2 Tax=Eubacterium TaxID=1730 RepID=A0A1H4A3S0_9FIRM|nr:MULTISPECIES: branched-chain amino acid ABC transporter permease [Eubacterium]MDD4691598.1 branched-chain amino acid ABC transporter permease [Eubacterium aggregans]MEA5074288.1 branched-chain amino acid ABC transporter permease [Eubacterium aggregans]SDX62120.1 branched-chain amino acid transport system permease protein [Eubacterium barkeri]SEA30793.1 branched-chain amino acid transport system permease protein [Eubacterium aggregans]